tara:strand:+ start:179 stop:1588 length:1410 start_codon:yes stop_codon:yes gene_type:complete
MILLLALASCPLALPSHATPWIGTPINDTCATPSVLVGTGTFPYDSTDATTSGFTGAAVPCNVPAGATVLEDDLFFLWTAPSNGTFGFNSESADLLDQVQLHRGSDCNAVCLHTNFQAGPATAGGVALFTASMDSGQDYLIQVGSWGPGETTTGSVTILSLPTETNIVCAKAIPVIGEFDMDVDNGSIWGSFPVDPEDVEPTCVPPMNDLFYLWTALCDGDHRIHTEATFPEVDTVLAVLDGTTCASPCLVSNDDIDGTTTLSSVTVLGAVAGQQYLIQIGTPAFTSDKGDLVLSVEHVGAPCPAIETVSVCDPASPHIDGGSAKLVASWMTTAPGSGLHLDVIDGPAGRTGMMLLSLGTGTPLPLFQGTLCLEAPFARYHPQPANLLGFPGLNSVGQFSKQGTGIFLPLFGSSHTGTGFDVPLETPAYQGVPMILTGDTWAFQLWFRDVDGVGAPSANFSNAIEVLFV